MTNQLNKKDKGGNSLVAQLSDALRKGIQSGSYSPGDKLPSTAQLTQEYGVSRTVVREAIAALRSDGLVDPRHGAGVFVLKAESLAPLQFQDVHHARVSSTLELLELRTAVEVEAAGLAATRRSPAQEENILNKHNEMQKAIAKEEPTSLADFALHLAIAEATNNPRFREFLEMIGSNSIPRTAIEIDSQVAPSYLQLIADEHARIVSAISDGDSNAAREAMRHHLQGSQRRYRDLLRNSR
jgi:GntR family transcriptional regulator, transcriptional repressor for pyruvate dehydrogenase complex